MTNDDSPIIDFYPDDFDIDMNGKKMVWQGVALLPFIDEKRLLKALKSKEPELSEDEKRRNRWGDNVMFIADQNMLYDPFCGLYTLKPATKVSLAGMFRGACAPADHLARGHRYQTISRHIGVRPSGSKLCSILWSRITLTFH